MTALARVTLAAVIAASLQTQAIEAPSVVGVHLASVHLNDMPGAPPGGWNNVNPGLYARWDNGFTLGGYRNSLNRNSFYAGWTFTDRADRFAVTLGVVNGYDQPTEARGDRQADRCWSYCRTVNTKDVVLPMVVPSVRIGITRKTSARVALLVAPRNPVVAHLALEHKF